IEGAILRPSGSTLDGGSMWDELKRADVELARQKLAQLRNVTLQRHAEELKQLDSDESEIDMLARLAEAITEKYLNGRTHADDQANSGEAVRDTARAEAEHEGAPHVNLEVRQNVSPNFGSPLRRLVGR